MLTPWKESYDQPRQYIKKQRHYFANKSPSSQSYGFSSSQVWYGCESWTIKKAECQRVDAFELWCWRDFWESPALQGDPTSLSQRRSVLGVHWKGWCWSWNSNTLVTWCDKMTHWKRSWCWEILKMGGKGDDRGWVSCMASPTQWTWVCVNSGSGSWTGRPGMLQFMGFQRVGHDWTGLNWKENWFMIFF